jgi:hypothetical protein
MMNERDFDALSRVLSGGSASRRTLSRGLAGAAITAGLTLFAWEGGDAKKRKKGKCKGTKPDGAACPGGKCQAGACVAALAPSNAPQLGSPPPPESPAPPPAPPSPPPPPPVCVPDTCPDPGPCKVRACADNVCTPGNAPDGASCGTNGETCGGGVCCPAGSGTCFGICVSRACQGDRRGGCNASCSRVGDACCGGLFCRATDSGNRCRP